jgi:hypothetical protein
LGIGIFDVYNFRADGRQGKRPNLERGVVTRLEIFQAQLAMILAKQFFMAGGHIGAWARDLDGSGCFFIPYFLAG